MRGETRVCRSNRRTRRKALRGRAVALLVLQPAAARARRVPRRLVADRLVGVPGLGATGATATPFAATFSCRAGDDVVTVLLQALHLGRLRLLLLPDELDTVDVLNEVLADRRRQRLEHVERLAL